MQILPYLQYLFPFPSSKYLKQTNNRGVNQSIAEGVFGVLSFNIPTVCILYNDHTHTMTHLHPFPPRLERDMEARQVTSSLT